MPTKFTSGARRVLEGTLRESIAHSQENVRYSSPDLSGLRGQTMRMLWRRNHCLGRHRGTQRYPKVCHAYQGQSSSGNATDGLFVHNAQARVLIRVSYARVIGRHLHRAVLFCHCDFRKFSLSLLQSSTLPVAGIASFETSDDSLLI